MRSDSKAHPILGAVLFALLLLLLLLLALGLLAVVVFGVVRTGRFELVLLVLIILAWRYICSQIEKRFFMPLPGMTGTAMSTGYAASFAMTSAMRRGSARWIPSAPARFAVPGAHEYSTAR